MVARAWDEGLRVYFMRSDSATEHPIPVQNNGGAPSSEMHRLRQSQNAVADRLTGLDRQAGP